MPDSSVPITAGTGTNIDTFTVPGGDHRQIVIPGDHGQYSGRFTSLRIPGRAGTTGQNIAAIWNAAGSAVDVNVRFIGIDLSQTVVKAVTVIPPIIRVLKLTTIPTNGTAGYKVAEDSNFATSGSVTTFQDAATEGASSGTALAFTQTAASSGLTQEFAPRYMGGAGTNPLYEPADRIEMLQNHSVTLNAGEGVGVRLEYTLATQNPTSDMWIVTMAWEEYTP